MFSLLKTAKTVPKEKARELEEALLVRPEKPLKVTRPKVTTNGKKNKEQSGVHKEASQPLLKSSFEEVDIKSGNSLLPPLKVEIEPLMEEQNPVANFIVEQPAAKADPAFGPAKELSCELPTEACGSENTVNGIKPPGQQSSSEGDSPSIYRRGDPYDKLNIDYALLKNRIRPKYAKHLLRTSPSSGLNWIKFPIRIVLFPFYYHWWNARVNQEKLNRFTVLYIVHLCCTMNYLFADIPPNPVDRLEACLPYVLFLLLGALFIYCVRILPQLIHLMEDGKWTSSCFDAIVSDLTVC